MTEQENTRSNHQRQPNPRKTIGDYMQAEQDLGVLFGNHYLDTRCLVVYTVIGEGRDEEGVAYLITENTLATIRKRPSEISHPYLENCASHIELSRKDVDRILGLEEEVREVEVFLRELRNARRNLEPLLDYLDSSQISPSSPLCTSTQNVAPLSADNTGTIGSPQPSPSSSLCTPVIDPTLLEGGDHTLEFFWKKSIQTRWRPSIS